MTGYEAKLIGASQLTIFPGGDHFHVGGSALDELVVGHDEDGVLREGPQVREGVGPGAAAGDSDDVEVQVFGGHVADVDVVAVDHLFPGYQLENRAKIELKRLQSLKGVEFLPSFYQMGFPFPCHRGGPSVKVLHTESERQGLFLILEGTGHLYLNTT